MEQILGFVLGVSACVVIWAIVVAFRTAAKVKTMQVQLQDAEQWIVRNDELVNRRIDQEIDRVDQLHRESISHTDSRVDRLDQKLTGTLGAKQVIKG